MCAGLSEWQTRWTQNPLVAIPCGFKSRGRHSLAGAASLNIRIIGRSAVFLFIVDFLGNLQIYRQKSMKPFCIDGIFACSFSLLIQFFQHIHRIVQNYHIGRTIFKMLFVVDNYKPLPCKILKITAEYFWIQVGTQKKESIGFGNFQGSFCHALAVNCLAEQRNQRAYRNIAFLAQRYHALGIFYVFQGIILFAARALIFINRAVEVDDILASPSSWNIINVTGNDTMQMAVFFQPCHGRTGSSQLRGKV